MICGGMKMNKAEFLEILRKKLSILDENELEDILNEYEQHIDMKAAGAMTEEAAIADFGDLDELASDILQAYHVRVDFDGKAGEDTAGKENRAQKALLKIGIFFKGCWKWLAETCGKAKQNVKGWAKKCSDFFRNLLKGGMLKEETEGADDRLMEEEPKKKKERFAVNIPKKEKREKMEKKNGNTFLSILSGMCRGCCLAILWCIKVFWNLFIGGTGIVMGGLSSFSLFLLGTLVVLLIQGYPLVGITIGFLGLTLCSVSMTVFCFTLIVRKRTAEKKQQIMDEENAVEEETVNA